MGFVGSSTLPVQIATQDTTVTIANVTIALANTEQSYALPSSTKRFLIRHRGGSDLKLAYNSGDSGTLFLTIPGDASYEDENYYLAQTLYFQSPDAGGIVEIVAYAYT